MIRTYIETRNEMRRKLQTMKKEIEDFYTEKEFLGKRVHVTGTDRKSGEKISFYAYYMGVKLEDFRENDIHLAIIFNKEFLYDKSVMLDDRNYRINRWDRSIKMKLAPYKPRKIKL